MTIRKHRLGSRLSALVALVWGQALCQAHADIVYQESGGMVVGEGEIYSVRTNDASGNGWLVVPEESLGAGTLTNARGDAFIQSLPDNGSGGGPLMPPEVRYRMQIFTPGTYRLYLRWDGNAQVNNGGNADSIFADIVELKDGTEGTFGSSTNRIADWYEFASGVDGDFASSAWRTVSQPEVNQAGASGYNAEWSILRAGLYTLRFSQREDGSAVDAFVFQLNSLPAPTGEGPPMSSLERRRIAFNVAQDTYLKRDDGTNALHGTEDTLLVKNDTSAEATDYDRNIYLRFDIAELHTLKDVVATNASLYIRLIDEGSGTNHDIYVAVIAEDAMAEHFNELALTPSIDPPSSNDVWTGANDEGVDFSKIYGGGPVGSFVVSSNNQYRTIAFQSPELLKAVQDDTDGVLAMVLYRTMDGLTTDSFASKEHPAQPLPVLDLRLKAAPPGSVLFVR